MRGLIGYATGYTDIRFTGMCFDVTDYRDVLEY